MSANNEESATTPQIPTKLIHLTYDGNFQLECEANVLECRWMTKEKEVEEKEEKKEDEMKVELQLDITTMHPQGGGQPSDLGTIFTPSCSIKVQHVSLDRSTGVVTHHGAVITPSPSPTLSTDNLISSGTSVQVKVDSDNRQILSECHTAGHVIDAAMDRCGFHLPPTKGYHFLDGPYVEYKGKLSADKSKEDIVAELNEAFQQIVEEDVPTKIQSFCKKDADALCNRLAQNFDFTHYDENDIRIVTVGGWPCPCGGTHVRSTSVLKERGWGVVGLRAKKGVVRVRYGCQE